MAITFNTRCPAALKNSAWQKKKSFKDKTKSATKTGLGAALEKAEKDWTSLQFDKLIAAKQNLDGKNVAERQKAKTQASTYLHGPAVSRAINSLQAAASKARTTAGNTVLSTTAVNAARTLSPLLNEQAKLLQDIKLDDFDPETSVQLEIGQLEKAHAETLRGMDRAIEELQSGKDRENWEGQVFLSRINAAVKQTGTLSEDTGDTHWLGLNNRWRQMFAAHNNVNRQLPTLSEQRLEEEAQEFIDLFKRNFGNVF